MQQTLFFILTFTAFNFATCQEIDGCPLYGCRPSGTFSFQQSVPHRNVSVHWISKFFIGPVPNALGCVGNSVQLLCQSNGPACDDTGYMSLSVENGAVKWHDPILRFPTLPLLGTSGDVIGSDGNNLVHYDADGKLAASVIKLDPTMRPIFSLQLVGTDLVLFVSESGQIALRETDGTPVVELFLHGTVERSNGTFVPVASPVSRGNRFYLLTEFVPTSGQANTPSVLSLQRLYAIDVFKRMTDRAVVAWYANFQREGQNTGATALKFIPKCWICSLIKKIRSQPELPKTSLLWNYEASMIFVSLPPAYLDRRTNAVSTFWGIKDLGNVPEVVFHTYTAVVNMVLFEPNTAVGEDTVAESNRKLDSREREQSITDGSGHDGKNMFGKTGLAKVHDSPQVGAGAQLWVTLDDGKICAVEKDGNFSKILDLPATLKADLKITSKMVTVREKIASEDFLIFGIKVTNVTSEFKTVLLSHGIAQTNATAFLVAIDTPENTNDNPFSIAWMLPTPDDTIVTGQIVGLKGHGSKPDQIVYFSQIDGHFAKIVSVV